MRETCIGAFTLLAVLLFHCAMPKAARADHSTETWEVINQHILGGNCASCHQAGTPFAAQSGLELTSDVAYDELVDVSPTNFAASANGLSRVSSAGGLPGLEQSFLWEKINVADQEHFRTDHQSYGALMPFGRDSLTNGELAYVKNWILAGAPETGDVANISLLEDTTRYEPPVFAPLTPPEQGIQLHLGPFDVWPSEVNDREFLYFEPLETTEDMYVNQYEVSYREGSHHFILYNYTKEMDPTGENTPVPNTYRDMRTQQGFPNFGNLIQLNNLFPFQFFIGTQSPQTNYQLPAGVALRMPAGWGFDLNTHSVNRSGETRTGEVYVNLHTIPLEEVEHVADYANFGDTNFNLPAGEVTVLDNTFTFAETQNIIQLWSHAHETMTEFRIEGVGGEHDGELIYWTNDWEHPPLLQLDTPMTFEAGDQIRLITTYNNETDHDIGFGPLSTDEMQFMFYVYYTGDLSTPDLPGDVNGDDVVDRSDLGQLAGLLGSGSSSADFDDDGAVSLLDLAVLQSNFRRSIVASIAVPEPGTLTLVLLGLGLVLFRRRRQS